MSRPVVIIGGGVAGLRCAQLLSKAGIDFLLLEKSDGIGGRMRTDELDGFRLDRGFQVFQTAYPEARMALDYDRLELQALEPGALIFSEGKWVRMTDPWRRPQYALSTLLNPIGTAMDRWRLLKLRRDCARAPSPRELSGGDISTRSLLRDEYGFTADFISRFMQPWLSGIFLETQLATSAAFFRFIFRMLSQGDISYPATGIQAIPNQLLGELEPSRVQLNVQVNAVDGSRVMLDGGDVIEASAVVVAVDMEEARSLLPGVVDSEPRGFNATRCTYFAADQPPINEATLVLNGTGQGPVNHLFVMSNASARVAPPGKALISVSSVGQEALAEPDLSSVVAQLTDWFGPQVQRWRELTTYRLRTALPGQPAGFAQKSYELPFPNLHLCGDYCETASLNGALQSGRLVAEAIMAARGARRTAS
jgi:phytoene dehydrogenase-like protein